MKYQGSNPVGQALANDPQARVRDHMLRTLNTFQAAAESSTRAAATLPATYQRQLASAECAALCAKVVTEFHAIYARADAGQQGNAAQIG
jgi:hypothetical protein